ncbi:GlxA family transcriptional regulator [Alkalimarinus alittae]|uniref:Helix-turn-helix domain-containing protein n=1 Tax=Alkalimarinus alittae TaxID=2961619 RepID=A0ABY6MXL0_9ALTE|nr:helix-turn-helix domain-containing protein [Alkalimarinus alittae]UZE94578.1 helix-turn-helix domain-containing protein [Alkalimarinus alittae]
MRHVTVIGFDYAFASAITGVSDLLSTAGVTWNYIHGKALASEFNVEIATLDGSPVKCANNIEVKAHKAINEIETTDLLLIPTIAGDIEQTLKRNSALIPWIIQQAKQGADIACNCTGAFLLAETGLLDNKLATTHWGFVEAFRQRYPKVDLRPEQLITADGSFFCSGGGMAWLDMALFLIERYCGYDIAMASAKSNVFDISKTSRAAYSSIPGKRYHQDNAILALQDWLDENFSQSMSVSQLAERTSMTERTLNRRFKQATGDSLIHYLQCLRVDAAKKLLTGEPITIELITQRVGYQDVSSFIRLFKKHTGMSPSAHRARFS